MTGSGTFAYCAVLIHRKPIGKSEIDMTCLPESEINCSGFFYATEKEVCAGVILTGGAEGLQSGRKGWEKNGTDRTAAHKQIV